MEVILLNDVEKVGLRGEVVNVARGYARNFLLPRRLAEVATPAKVAELQKRDALRARHEAQTVEQAQQIAARLGETELRFEVKAGPTGTLFGSVTPTQIADELWRAGKIRVDRRKIEIDAIKRIGRYQVPIELFTDVRAEVTTLVVPEGGELPSDAELAAMEAAERAEREAEATPAETEIELAAALAELDEAELEAETEPELEAEQKVWKRTVAPPIEDRVLPRVFGGIDATVETIFRQGGWLLIAFAAALALLDVASAVRSIMSSLNEIAVAEEGRPTWLRFAVSFALAVVVIVCLVGAVLVVSVGGWLAGSSGGVLHLGLGIARWLAAIVLLLTVAVVVRYGGYRPRSKTWVSIGSGAIVAAWVVLSLAFKWFVASVASYRSGPGILVAFLILTTYVYASAIVFLVGVQLDELVGRR